MDCVNPESNSDEGEVLLTTAETVRRMARFRLFQSEGRKSRTNKRLPNLRLQQSAARIRACDERLSFEHKYLNFADDHRLASLRTA